MSSDTPNPGGAASPVFQRLCLVGVGLLGSSIARASQTHGLAAQIVLCDCDAVTLKRAEELELGDVYLADAAEAVTDCDLVILCTPVGSYGALAAMIAPQLAPGAVLSDVGSVKSAVVEAIAPHVPDGVHFIPGHPIAGTEQSGPDAGFGTPFEGRWFILTPLPGTDEAALSRLSLFWEQAGSSIEIMNATHHDLVLAITSHIPHLIAYNIVGTAADMESITKSEIIKFSASGFRDFTRLAASDPVMWRDVFLNNREAVLEMLGRFTEDLSALQRAIRWGKGDELHDYFSRTRSIRREIIEAGQESPEPDFGRHAELKPVSREPSKDQEPQS
jgi:cyclohexadieny/prephenate dehydrogenase